jgi:outer membrane protein assembly factor BamE (lipoprotein component of BamABCDE complex)
MHIEKTATNSSLKALRAAPKASCFILAALVLSGCISAADHAAQVHSNRGQEFTLGIVQREVRRGMSQSDVAVALGSPNIVTREDNGNETWVYDKIATEASQSSDSGGLWLLLGNYDKSAGASATTQKTLTVVIKFDKFSRVDSFTYHSTKF